ncbi:MAG: hypothetical protein CMM50_02220 [Rhodospirillaceae bacterium]|mgnify:CR=1 FL=1|nr:hypothetical protein [Rhodospirillaceae bacterium]
MTQADIPSSRQHRSRPPVKFVQIEPTTRCNYTCGFCVGRQMEQADLPVDTFWTVLDSFPEIEHIELQGEGEPLLNKDFMRMARAATDRGIRVSIITNGSLLTDSAVEGLIDARVAAVRVSIESADPDTFKRIRGGRLDKVIAGIERLLAAKAARATPYPTVGFQVTVLKETVDALEGIAALHDRLGMDGGIGTQPLSSMPTYRSVYDTAMNEQRLDRDSYTRLRIARQAPRIQELMQMAQQVGHFYTELSRAFPSAHGCPWVKGGLYIDRNGNATSCCMVKDPTRYGMGRMGTDSPEQILGYRHRLDAVLRDEMIPEQCNGCAYIAPMVRRKLAEKQAVRSGPEPERD